MSEPGSGAELNDDIAAILRFGTILSAAVIAVGVALTLVAPPSGAPSSLGAMLSSGFGTPSLSVPGLLSGLSVGSPLSVLELGTLILLATPLVRVAASVLLFAKERDSLYASITLLVFVMLVLAIFVIGPAEA